MKRSFGIAAICLLLLLAAFPVSAKQTTRLTLDASAQAVCPGQSFRVTLSLSDALPDVGSLEVHLHYDADALEFKSARAGSANAALQVIEPGDEAYTGVLFVYDYGTDGGADKSFAPETLLTVEFMLRPDAEAETLTFSLRCAAALNTAFQPLPLHTDTQLQVRAAHPTLTIRNFVRARTVDYRTTVKLHAELSDGVPNGEIVWFTDGQEAATGETLTLSQMRQDTEVTVVYRAGDAIAASSEPETITVKNGFFARLLALLRGWFGTLRIVEQVV